MHANVKWLNNYLGSAKLLNGFQVLSVLLKMFRTKTIGFYNNNNISRIIFNIN